MEPAQIKEYIAENLDQIPDELLAELAQQIHDYHLDQASQEIQALNLTEFTNEQLAQLAGVSVEVIEGQIKRWENSKRPAEIFGSLQITKLYTGKIQNQNIRMRCWFDESEQRWIKGMYEIRRREMLKAQIQQNRQES